ncbi:MAG: hypothetical protein D6701_11255, partial [Gemmatimonadetes bacterium]
MIYAGGGTGGVWKSSDGGVTWSPIFDDQPASSIGAIAVHPTVPDLVWVGTGEGNPRNSAGVGRGIFRSRDGGRTWEHMGLERSERIHRVVLDPDDPDRVYVAALGPSWSDGQERGVFRSRDGGETWERVLYVDERTGASDLVMDPHNPRHLIAGMWSHRREPWFMTSGGPGSGLYTSWDGGDTWTRVETSAGLPAGELGRIGVAFAASAPGVVYALVEAGKSALLRSDDGGATWRTVNASPGVDPRPFYFNDIFVDPTDELRVYRLASTLDMSEDGGRTFRTIGGWESVHPDHHALWIDPGDGRTLIDGNDGGVFISHDRGESWRFVENLPMAQFYHISVDMARPFNVLGGLQDNGSWRGPSEVRERTAFVQAGIMNHHWKTIGFGDGFAAFVDSRDSTYAYASSQGGNIIRTDLRTGEWKNIAPPPPDDSTELRFNWNAGMAMDPLRPGVLYLGSQFLHRTSDMGLTWEILSPDLTTNDPAKQRQKESGGLTRDVTAAENHTTIIAIAPSPVQEGVIWVGTDDGNVQLTRDDGATWTNVGERIRGVPEATWVPHVEASHHDAGTAYVAFDNHRRGDWTTYLYRTRDFGRSWERLDAEGIDGFAHTIVEDPIEPRLLFVGTEFGLWVSLDGGEHWTRWKEEFPTVPVRSLVVHPRDHDLVIGTHGRAAWIVDDIRPLRALAADPESASRPLTAFAPPPAVQHTRGISGPYYFPGDTRFHGANRPYGALLTYGVGEGAIAAATDGENGGERGAVATAGGATVRIEILSDGEVIRELTGPATPGLNRVVWDLRRRNFDLPSQGGPGAIFGGGGGPEVLPGRYTVRYTLGEHEAETEVEVVPDPRRDVP